MNVSLYRTLTTANSHRTEWLQDVPSEELDQTLLHLSERDPEEEGWYTHTVVSIGTQQVMVQTPESGGGPAVYSYFTASLPQPQEPSDPASLIAHLAVQYAGASNLHLGSRGEVFGHLPDLGDGRTRLPDYAGNLNAVTALVHTLSVERQETLRLLILRAQRRLNDDGLLPSPLTVALALAELSGQPVERLTR